MNIIIKKDVARRLGYDSLRPFGVSRESWETWRDQQDLDIGKLSAKKLDDLDALLTTFKKVRGVGVLLHDIAAWRRALEDGAAQQRARTVRQFEALLKQYLLDVPGHRIYKRHEEGALLAYYVKSVEYHPPSDYSGRHIPAYVEMKLVYEELGGKAETSASFEAEDCRNVPVAVALSDKGYQIEDRDLRAQYLDDMKVYAPVATAIGKQFWGRGLAYEVGDRYERGGSLRLDRDGLATRVVIDLFSEEEKSGREHSIYLNEWYWPNVASKSSYDPETDEDEAPINEDVVLQRPEIEVPIHPWCVVFHLAKHIRLKVHVRQLEEYVYDAKLAEKLILPRDQKALVKLLIDTKGGMFKDIVAGKGGGAVVLLSGPPGTGKTLTAEVYAESESRPLYSVQCSQLGTDPDHLEAALLKVFERGKRWNAVMLLDEADVYVHERGASLDQNAIVGVFLRVLEYQATILFLTTNRSNDVDDAIASRCVARLNYVAPDPADATRIWRVLAENAGITVAPAVVSKVVADNPGMTGRDIKNVLKLASLMPECADGVSAEAIAYVQQFKPTGALVRARPVSRDMGLEEAA